MAEKSLFWFRQDLRLWDNPGLYEAVQKGLVMAIYILDEEGIPKAFRMGAASRWWLHHSLSKLNESLGGKLNVYQGNPKKIILNLLQTHHFKAVFWNHCYEPWGIKRDVELQGVLKKKGVHYVCSNASLLWDPREILKKDGTFYKVFTAFYQNGCLKSKLPHQPIRKPESGSFIQDPKCTLKIKDLNLLPSVKWYSSIEPYWVVGEEGAQIKLSRFVEELLHGYKEMRDFPAKNHVSRLSPHLHFGEISPHQIWYAVQKRSTNGSIPSKDVEHFLKELGWREFSYYLLYHFPVLPRENFNKKFNRFPWRKDTRLLKAWQQGKTGYPFVDAGMRELWQTGYMHNRLRMVVGSFLVKNLLLDWHLGEDWFWDCLLDADLANNSASWQWVAGSGADSAPYFRIFNPVMQGEKYDPDGTYTRRFVPELSRLPNRYLFKPWEAPETVLKDAGVILGKTYPKPVVDLKASRDRALLAFADLKSL